MFPVTGSGNEVRRTMSKLVGIRDRIFGV
jgi:hypothetical protein